MVVTTGGIGGNHAKVRRQWPDDTAPDYMLSGVPASVDGEFLSAVGSAGAALVNGDRMWHYGIGLWKEHSSAVASSRGGPRAGTSPPVSKLKPWSGRLTSWEPTSNPAGLTPQGRMAWSGAPP